MWRGPPISHTRPGNDSVRRAWRESPTVCFLRFVGPVAVSPERPKMLPTLVRRVAQASKPQIEAAANPTKLKKVWPPDFSKLSPQEQLRFEKRYKRRISHIAQRPKWTKMIKFTQYFTITCMHLRLFALLPADGFQLSSFIASSSWIGRTRSSPLMMYVFPLLLPVLCI